MFTGIIIATGKIIEIQAGFYTIQVDFMLSKGLIKGQSISVDGVCLTIINFSQKKLQVEVMPETKRKTSFKNKQVGDLVNLELAMPANGRFDGHIVQGHVDSVGKILAIKKDGNAHLMQISLPEKLKPYCIPQGSITVNGISFTIAHLETNFFTIGIIPHTWQATNLHQAKIGDSVNLEGDILGKYLFRFKELKL